MLFKALVQNIFNLIFRNKKTVSIKLSNLKNRPIKGIMVNLSLYKENKSILNFIDNSETNEKGISEITFRFNEKEVYRIDIFDGPQNLISITNINFYKLEEALKLEVENISAIKKIKITFDNASIDFKI